MEVELRFDEVMGAYQSLVGLMDKPFVSMATAVRLGDALRRLNPLFEDVAQRHDKLLEEHAKRNAEGEIIYLDEEKTRIDLEESAQNALMEFMGNTVEVNLPRLVPGGLQMSGDSGLRLLQVMPLAFLFECERMDVVLKKGELLDVLGAVDNLAGDTFAYCEATVKLAISRWELAKASRQLLEQRWALITDLAEKDEDGALVYEDEARTQLKVTTAMADAIDEFLQQELTLQLPKIEPDDLVLAGEAVLSPRRTIGVLPILSME